MRAPTAQSGWWIEVVLIALGTTAALPSHAQPVAVDDSYTTEPRRLNVGAGQGVLANDSPDEDGALAAALVSSTSNGKLDLRENGGFTYEPNRGFMGADTFTYVARGGSAQSNVATVTITVAGPVRNAPPVAAADAYTTDEGAPLSVSAPGVLANDSDPEGAPLTAALDDDVDNGVLAFEANGSFTYTPRAGFAGVDRFRYRASDGTASSPAATVTITVSAVNEAPVAHADSYSVNEGATLNVNAGSGVLGNDTDADGDRLTAVLVAGPSSGTLTLNANGSFRYVPAAAFTGTVSFVYRASDGTASSADATVTIAVNAANRAPIAQPDSFTTTEDQPLAVGGAGVLENDTDPDGDSLTAERASNVTTGTLQLRPDGTFTYTPPANFRGTATFTYRAHDGKAASAAVSVTITVSPVNDAPFVTNSPPTTATEGRSYRYTLAASDPDDDELTIAAPRLPGWLTFTPPATIAGTPSEDDVGAHDVTMTVSDGKAATVERSFRITVEAVDDAPTIAAIPEQTATEAAAFELDLKSFVTDRDTAASALEFRATGGLPRGLSLSAAGRLAGTPETGTSVGAHVVRFTVSDATTTVAGQVRVVVLAAGRVDLAASMRVAPNPTTLDTPATWTIQIANRAPDVAASGATLEALFVGDVPFQFDAPATQGCTLTPSGEQNRLACTLGPIAGGASTTISLTGRGSFAGDVAGSATVAVAAGGALDEMRGNDRASASLSIAQRVAATPAQSIELAGARAAAAGDFDGDGFDDLAVATASAQGLVVFMNVADPANPGRRMFAVPGQSLGGEALNAVAVADLDRDGDLDIVTAAGEDAPNRAFLNAGGVFTSVALGDESVDSRAVAAGDINGDAFVDLVFASAGTSIVLLNSGSGAGFTRGTGLGPHAARDVLLADLSADSLPEVVLANADGGASVYANEAGTLRLAATLATGPTSAVAAGDFNGDRRADLVFARESATPPAVPSALVWLATADSGNPFFVADELGAAAATGVLVDDFNLDTRPDVFVLDGGGARLFTNAGAANGTFLLHAQQIAASGVRGGAFGRFSGDERVDLAVVGEGGLKVYVNNGNGDFGQLDATRPVLELRGPATVSVTIDGTYTDAGATATDAEDGDLTSRIVVTNPVDTTVLGTYTVTYAVTDSSGNAAVPVTRTVTVQPQAEAEGGGGGAVGLAALVSLLWIFLARVRRRRPS